MMKKPVVNLLILAGFMIPASLPAVADGAAAACLDAPYDKAALVSLKQNDFKIDHMPERIAVAHMLLACLSHPDSETRDFLALGGLMTMMRRGDLEPVTLRDMRDRLLDNMAPGKADPEGFLKPFSALALAEVARVDRVKPYLDPRERMHLVQAAADYMTSITDYRGFIPGEGWRHGVAHAADWLMQLAIHPELGRDEALIILQAVAAQVAPAGHAYIYGESQRLARPVHFVAIRDVLTQDEWENWFLSLADPATRQSWDGVYTDGVGLDRLHNLMAFAQAMYVGLSTSSHARLNDLAPVALNLIRALP